MADATDEPPPPQLTGIVIITLPPPDKPSQGKTITAFTLSDDHQPSTPQPDPPHPTPRTQPSRTFIKKSPRIVLPVLGVSLIALYFWVSVSEETLFQLRDVLGEDDEMERHRKNSSKKGFLFPLYRKEYGGYRGGGGVVEFGIKLGGVVGLDVEKEVVSGVGIDSVSAASEIDAAKVMPVRGNVFPDGLYYTYIHFGNPPRPYFLDLDTGSDLTWIQCDAPCTSCAKGAHPFYKPVTANILPPKDSYCLEIQRNQLTSRPCDGSCHQCDYEIEYADHSSSTGVLARDEIYLNIANGSLTKSKYVFGCAYHQQGLLLNTLGKTDGILGLSRAKISLPSQLASQGFMKNVVGHCLATDASVGGYFFLGDDFVPHRQMAWIPILQSHDSNSYLAEVVKASYGNRQIQFGDVGFGQERLVFDTGSTYSYFTEQAYNNLVAMLDDISSKSLVRDMTDTSLPVCWRAQSPLKSVKDVAQLFKPLKLQFGSKWWVLSKTLQIPPEGYLVTNSKGNVCLGILNGRKEHDGSTFILGDISLRGLLFVYDNVNDKIGWVRSDCAKPRRFESHSLY